MSSRRATRTTNSAPKPIQNGPVRSRATGSQSADSNAIEVNTGTLRRGGRATSTESTENARTRKGKRAAANPSQGLAPLAEESEGKRDSHGFPKSPGAHSNISGTTARTSNSVHELSYLDSDKMREELPGLYDFSDKVVNLCVPSNPSKEAFNNLLSTMKSESRAHKNLVKYKEEFDNLLNVFTPEGLISLPVATRALLKISRSENIGDGPWRPDEAFFKANLASTLEELISCQAGLPTGHFTFEKLDRDFPEHYLACVKTPSESYSTGSSTLLEETFKVALELRTQFAIQTLVTHSHTLDFDARRVVEECFHEAENGHLRAWNVEGLKWEQLSTNQKETIYSRISQMQKFCHDHPDSINSKGLQSQYPVFDFVRSFVTWARARNNEIKERLSSLDSGRGIGDDLQEALDKELDRRQGVAAGGGPSETDQIEIPQLPSDALQSDSSAQDPRPDIKPKSTGSGKFNSPASLQRLKARAKEVSARDQSSTQPVSKPVTQERPEVKGPENPKTTVISTAPAKASQLRQVHLANPTSSQPNKPPSAQRPQDVRPMINNVDYEDADIDLTPLEDDASNTAPRQPTVMPAPVDLDAVIPLQRRIAQEGDKENNPPRGKIFERQPDATRVSFDSQPSVHGDSPQPGDNEENQTSDISEDEGFETDTRPHPPRPSSRGLKRPATTTASHSSAKKPRTSQSNSSPRPPSQRPAQPPSRHTQTQSEAPDYKYVNSQAKTLTNERVNMKPVQTRTAWSEQETDALIELIEEYGISWALLKKKDDANGQHLISRGQVALKDKARNMKFDFLKAKVPLPVNFALIPLKQTQKNVLWEDFEVKED